MIGQQLQRQLLADGYGVRALVRPGSPHLGRLDTRSETAQVRLDDLPGLREAVTGVSAVVYCAGSVRGRTFEDFAPANVHGVRHVAGVLSELDAPPPMRRTDEPETSAVAPDQEALVQAITDRVMQALANR